MSSEVFLGEGRGYDSFVELVEVGAVFNIRLEPEHWNQLAKLAGTFGYADPELIITLKDQRKVVCSVLELRANNEIHVKVTSVQESSV